MAARSTPQPCPLCLTRPGSWRAGISPCRRAKKTIIPFVRRGASKKNDVYLLDLFRGRLEYPDLRRKVIALAQLHRPATILIEDAGPGMSLLQDLRNSMPAGLIRPIGVRPVGHKVDRMFRRLPSLCWRSAASLNRIYMPMPPRGPRLLARLRGFASDRARERS